MKSTMNLCAVVLGLISSAQADTMTYALSPDGSAVVRTTGYAPISAGSFDSSLLPPGYIATTGTALGGFSVTGDTPNYYPASPDYPVAILGATFTGTENAFTYGGAANFIQVINTNDPDGTSSSPYLDSNLGSPVSFLLTPGSNFFDTSGRSPSDLNFADPINWAANLYPVTVAGMDLTVFNGESWGWTIEKATVGSSSAVFTDPLLESQAVVSGVGTSSFAWGDGDASSLSFQGKGFNTTPSTPFDLGTLTFHNGSNTPGTDADAVDLDLSISFDNVPEKNFDLKTSFALINTPNTFDPVASADYVVVGNYGYTFNVFEGQTASVDLYGELTTTLSGLPIGTSSLSDFSLDSDVAPQPNYVLTLVGLGTPTSGGFTTGTSVTPEPESLMLVASGALGLLLFARKQVLFRR